MSRQPSLFCALGAPLGAAQVLVELVEHDLRFHGGCTAEYWVRANLGARLDVGKCHALRERERLQLGVIEKSLGKGCRASVSHSMPRAERRLEARSKR